MLKRKRARSLQGMGMMDDPSRTSRLHSSHSSSSSRAAMGWHDKVQCTENSVRGETYR